MDGARAVCTEGAQVCGCAVAFVSGESIIGPVRITFMHELVARDLGKDAGGGNAETLLIAFNNGCLREGKRRHAKPIHQRVRCRRARLCKRIIHRTMSGLEDIDLIDDAGIHDPDPKMDFRFGMYCVEQFAAHFLAEFFGIV